MKPVIRSVSAAFFLALLVPAAHAVVIDDYSTDQAEISVTPDGSTVTASSSVSGGGIVGGSRDLLLTTNSDPDPFSIDASVSGGFAHFSAPSQSGGTLLFQWDGGDGTSSLDTGGLGSVDLTDGGDSNSFEIGIAVEDLPSILTLTVYSPSGSSTASIPGVPGTGLLIGPTSVFVFFAAFSGSADFTDVGAVELVLESVLGEGLDMSLDFVRTTEAVPLPAAFWLFASGLFGIGVFRRRR